MYGAGGFEAQRSIIAHKLASSRASNMGKSRSGIIGEDREEITSYNQQVLMQRMEILKDAFSNPIETLLEYEPWS